MANVDGPLTSKDFKITKLNIITSSGINLSVLESYNQLQIFQSIYHGTMYGNIVITDAREAWSNFNFCGNEFVEIVADNPGLNRPFKRTFRIYKVTDRTTVSNSAQKAILHFCSDELMSSNSILVSKSYKNAKIRDIASDILKNELKISSNRIAKLEDTLGNYDIIIPAKRPLEAISWATSRAYTQDKFCYFFFENKEGFNLVSLQTLMKQKPYKTIKYEVKKVDSDPSKNKDGIDDFKIVNDFDSLTTLSNGGFSSRLLLVDVFSQSFKMTGYNLNNAESKNNLMNKFKPVNDVKNSRGESLFDSPGSFFRMYPTVSATKTEKSNDIEYWYLPRALHMTILNNFKIHVTIPGDIEMKAGDVVDVEFPMFEPGKDGGRAKNKRFSGKYLVAGLNYWGLFCVQSLAIQKSGMHFFI